MKIIKLKVFFLLLIVSLTAQAQTGGKYILVDQFGYPPDAKKVAIIRDPQVGYDADEVYEPGTRFSVIEVSGGDVVYTGVIEAWKNGTTDESSGDRVWHFDFSSLTETGTYYILDEEKGQRSYEFVISPSVYNDILKVAVRTFFYQRVGYAKEAQYAGEEWADGASHIGPLQDLNCRSFFDKDNPATERDVSGAWYDAGDYNKYTNWTANYIVDFMKAYLENPAAWGDDYNIPESGNGIADILDEAKWGIDHLMRMQNLNGSVLSIVGEAHGSPPSSVTGPSYYGKVNTSSALNVSAALGLASTVYRKIGQTAYADTLLVRAEKAWEWADANPDVLFNNNSSEYNSTGLGAGRQELDDYGRQMAKLEAACFLLEASGDTKYREHFDANYTKCHMMEWNWAYPYEITNQEVLLYYTLLENGSAAVQENIRNVYRNTIKNDSRNYPAISSIRDPYFAFLDSYTWGSNRTKSAHATMYTDMLRYALDPGKEDQYLDAALHYVNYIHGVNPMSMAYISNMATYGAENSANEFYHSWFSDGSAKWDRVGESMYGPAPGFIPGGPNPSYDRDDCCPTGCGSASNNSKCTSVNIYPPKGQPAQKSYKDFNSNWPLNSWEVTENSCGYQLMYIRLLSHFVIHGTDCNGDVGGTAFMDSCGICAGGNTGIIPELDPAVCEAPTDCNGDAGGTAFMDSCEICAGGNTGRDPVLDREACYDCNGDFNGSAIEDACEICAGGETGREPITDPELCKDCNGDFNGTAMLDSCGNCSGGETGIEPVLEKDFCYDCNNDFNGTAITDSCGICSGGQTGLDPILDKALCYDCNGDFNGTAFIDSCGICAGGNTGVVPILDSNACAGNYSSDVKELFFRIYPNPSSGTLKLESDAPGYSLQIVDMRGNVLLDDQFTGNARLDISWLKSGTYEIIFKTSGVILRRKLIKL